MVIKSYFDIANSSIVFTSLLYILFYLDREYKSNLESFFVIIQFPIFIEELFDKKYFMYKFSYIFWKIK